jgi:hypothetical protein
MTLVCSDWQAAFSGGSSVDGFKHAEDVLEEVDDVEVELDGGDDVLVVGVALDEVVGVVDDEAGEDQRGDAAVHHRPRLAHREEDPHEREDHHDEAGGHQEWSQELEVVAFLRRPEGVGGQPGHHHQRDRRRLHYDDPFREEAAQPDGEAHADGEERQEHEVDRVPLTQADHRDHHCKKKRADIIYI